MGTVWGGAPIIAITLFHNLLHYRLLLTCLKNMTRGLLMLTWLSLAVGINSKAVHSPGKEGGCGFSSKCKERPPARHWGRYRQLCAWLAVKGGDSRDSKQAGTASPCPDLPPGPGPCARAASHEASWAPLAWSGTAQSPTGTAKEAASPGSSRIYSSQEWQSIATGWLPCHLWV